MHVLSHYIIPFSDCVMRAFRLRAALMAAAATVQAPAMAQATQSAAAADEATPAPQAAEATPEPEGTAAKAHSDDDDAIVITGSHIRGPGVLNSPTMIGGDELARDLKPSIGDTLADLPGVSASSFGPSSSRPILRGESGERVRILVDGIGSLDLSSSDPDHAVAINPLTAIQIQVLRGPSAFLYSSAAIAGVVNVIDARIPRSIPAGKVSLDALLNYGSAANERSGNLQVNAALGSHLVAHVDGAYSKYDDLRIGGYVLSRPMRDKAAASSDAGIHALADLKGKLPNTAGQLGDLGAGLTWVDGDLNVGFSLSHHDSRYGVPIRYSLDPAVTNEAPVIDAHQNRADVRADIPLGGRFESIDFRGGIAKYHHSEIEPDGMVGTRFYSNGKEGRVELAQRVSGGWGGTSGISFLEQNSRITGAEKYLPDSDSRQTGLFTLQTFERGRVRAEAALRADFARVHADPDAAIALSPEGDRRVGSEPLTRTFRSLSAAVGANTDVGGGWRFGLNLSHSERSPSIDELFSKGAHGGSQQFLVGNPDLKSEKSNGVEFIVDRAAGPLKFKGSLYYSRYSNFIFQSPTDEIADGLPLYNYFQGKADYYGFDVEADAKFGKAMGIDWSGELTADAVRAKIERFGNAPEIPPLRVLGGLAGSRGQVDARVEVEHVWAQNTIAPDETRTPGYTMVNASLDWHPLAGERDFTLSLSGNNLFDVNARRHSSDLKDYAPLAGRDIRLSARFSF